MNTTTEQYVRAQAVHPLLPKPLAKPIIIRWLKKTHAWIGVWGAIAGLVFAWSGFNLNHRTDFRLGADVIVTESTVDLPAGGISSPEALEKYIKDTFDLNGPAVLLGPDSAPTGMGAALPPQYKATFQAASNDLVATYLLDSDKIQITQTERPFTRLVNRLHVGRGTSDGWVLLINVFSGALIFLSITGVLIWSKLSGPRLAGIGLLSTTVLLTAYYMFAGP